MEELPFLTDAIPGIGGQTRTRPDDFTVEEIPLYPCSGEGTHLFIRIEKTRISTEQAVRELANALGIGRRDVGFAGLKDAHAVARQTLSVEHVDPDRVRGLSLRSMTVLAVDRHTNKLKLGHLKGNRFSIKLREPDPEATDRAKAVLAELTRRGMPNYFGPQRFGLRGDNPAIGSAALRGDYQDAVSLMLGRPSDEDEGSVLEARRAFEAGNYEGAARKWPYAFSDRRQACRTLARLKGTPRRAWVSLRWPSRRMFLSALQSQLFNRVVARRIDELDQVLAGDLAYKHVNGAVFRVEDSAAEQPRADAFEISATGPLFGRRMTEPEGKPAEIESEVLAEANLPADAWSGRGKERMDGARRPIRVRPDDAAVDAGKDDLEPFLLVEFTLPRGSYATSLLRELCKREVG